MEDSDAKGLPTRDDPELSCARINRRAHSQVFARQITGPGDPQALCRPTLFKQVLKAVLPQPAQIKATAYETSP